VCAALGAAPLIAAATAGGGGDPIRAGVPVLDLHLRDDAVSGLPGVLPPGPLILRVTNDASSDRGLTLAHVEEPGTRVLARTAVLAPGDQDLVGFRLGPGRWIAAQAGVSRAPAAVTLVPAPSPGAPR
jgi:hypothetical protein